jgi:hypothetical protein
MATFYDTTTGPIVDPDQLGYSVNPVSFAAGTEEILIFTATKTIALKVTGNLTTNGATIKSVYSKLKDAWRSDTELIKYPFPMSPITDEQFELVNGWNWDKTNTSGDAVLLTPELLRTGGWSVVNTDGLVIEQWAGIITLGSFVDNTNQAYYQQGSVASAVNVKLTNPVNQAVQILSDPNGDGSYGDGFDRRSYFKIFVREWQRTYAQSELLDIGVSQLTYQAYRFPLTNSVDLKVTHTEIQIDANSDGTPDQGVYANVNITYLRHSDDTRYTIEGDWVSATSYQVADVVRDATLGIPRWFKCIQATAGTTAPNLDATNWAVYEGERQIGTDIWYAYTVIIDGDTTAAPTASGAARTAEVYEAVQYYLRQATDIDADATASVIGKTAPALLRFVGDTLVTSPGVYVDSFNTQDTNAIEFVDWSGTSRTFPYVAALTLNFGDNLQNDQYAKYWVFFTNAGGNLYGTANAIIVDDKDNVDMAGDVNNAWPTKRASVSHSFNYDSNVQGGRTAATPADVTAVAIGLVTGQFVRATGTIQRSTANSISLTASLERNYSAGTTYP